MTLREKILTEFQNWDSEKQLHEFQAYKCLDGYSPLSEVDYSLMEQIMNNNNASIDCEGGNCKITFESKPEVSGEIEIMENVKTMQEIISEKEDKLTKTAESIWDRKNGVGAVPNQSPNDIAYFGFEAKMKASDFLALADDLPNKDLTYLTNHFEEGGTFGLPFLGIDWYGDEESPRRKKQEWVVDKHEGRHRVEFFMNQFGDKEIIVSIFTARYSGELRNRNLQDYMFAKGIKLRPQSRAKNPSKLFEIADLIIPKFVDFEIGKNIKEKENKDDT
jgi:hypothetical protein